ncbi:MULTISPECIES: SpoIIE family protein phosphatase [Limnospira]|uniref:SpoIIE family protein phosphatase n=1 Tax=Limnospira fusiformis PMC 851.14 TaxID=2219512 RepID=A0ABU9EFB7_LIMFS
MDTIDLGFPVGLEPDISQFVHKITVRLNPQDVLILFTDGITEGENSYGQHYGIDRLCEVALCHHEQTSEDRKNAIVSDVFEHIGRQRIFNNITLIILKQK